MCTKSLNCICHHLEIAIKQDVTKELKAMFDTCYVDELYNFLTDAYQLLQIKANHKFATSINKLVKDYLLEKSPKSINVESERIKKGFMDLYDENIDDLESAKLLLTEKLILLIQDVQHLAYQNLAHIDSFRDCLEKVDKSNTIAGEDKKAHNRRGCNIL
ncbi:hypothetical protein DGG96_04205 [Legionella qingyii]|uniref:Uncharacterized protein n=1 Tax=Legionella qingyii TaxID=2184757 RepID=A0A317U931_9GAMM|nr:hypothetical protein [Legionella qingyii]PWY56930.1 hypothetical protein DGG96_04205 [Legionella qingyii]RUR24428.1 hypothetical protein ELY20_05030 [Legionella qingyii]RUR27077.1 hypothetical protein ELY16_05805 [Legionella qingyii]